MIFGKTKKEVKKSIMRIKKPLTPKDFSRIKKQKNIDKELRIARATTGHERQVHLDRAEKLQSRYKSFNPFSR